MYASRRASTRTASGSASLATQGNRRPGHARPRHNADSRSRRRSALTARRAGASCCRAWNHAGVSWVTFRPDHGRTSTIGPNSSPTRLDDRTSGGTCGLRATVVLYVLVRGTSGFLAIPGSLVRATPAFRAGPPRHEDLARCTQLRPRAHRAQGLAGNVGRLHHGIAARFELRGTRYRHRGSAGRRTSGGRRPSAGLGARRRTCRRCGRWRR